jgi:hypothetical protein
MDYLDPKELVLKLDLLVVAYSPLLVDFQMSYPFPALA